MSSTSSILEHISVFRNPTLGTQSFCYLKAVAAQCAYIAIVPYAIFEAAISQIVRAISYCLVNEEKYQKIADWANSSAYSVVWSVHCIFVNLCVKKIAPTENDFKANILNIKPESNDDESVIQQPALVNPLPQPVIPVPTSKDPAIAKLLNGYRLGDNAKRYSELMEKIYCQIPQLTDKQFYRLRELTELLRNRPEPGVGSVLVSFEAISIKMCTQEHLTVWEDRLLKMTVAIYDAIMKLTGDDLLTGTEILVSGLLDAFANCSNRQSAEIERLYFLYVAPELLAAVEAAATPGEKFTFELMQYRTEIRDGIINIHCPDEHNAASHRYFRKRLNESTFYLPSPLLSEEDNHYDRFALKDKEQEIINTFQGKYNRPGTIYDILIGLLYPKANEVFRFKPETFLKWLDEKGLMNLDAFSDEAMEIYKPEIMVAFLEDHGFLIKNDVAF